MPELNASPPPATPPPAALLAVWLSQSHDLLALTDAGGVIRWCNRAFERATSLTTAADLPMLAPPRAPHDTARAQLAAALREGRCADADPELALLPASAPATDALLWVQLRVAPVGDDRLWTLRDTTAQRELAAREQHVSELLDMAQEFGRRVSDNERGMTPAQLGQLFEPFNRLGVESQGIEGSGIGLTISRALVEGMSGRIEASSEAGRGTTFEVTLPHADSAAPSPESPAQPQAQVNAAARAERSGQLLYIEDNPVNVLLAEELVKGMSGLRISSEPTGAGGVARALALHPDPIVIDMQLPDFDGVEVLRQLRAQPKTASTPCIALSANAMPKDIQRALAAGFDDYWTKPIRFKPFLDALDRFFPGSAKG